jgi:hypothetical protein
VQAPRQGDWPDRIASRQIAASSPVPSPATGPVAPPSPARAPASRAERAIADAARRTSIDFGYLVAQARIESAMNPDARATVSSATGLYQFIESTWLSTMQRHGARFGLGDIAARIARGADGEAEVADPAARRAILALRRDPEIAALMAAGLAEDNRAHLASVLGRQPDHSELYLAHFLGAGGAARFLTEMARDPDRSAAALFPRPAAANPGVFHDAGGRARSLAEVMAILSARLEQAGAPAEARPKPPPYLAPDDAVFGPGTPVPLTGTRRPTIAPSPVLSAPLAPSPQRIPPMSSVLSATFERRVGDFPALDRAGEHTRAAYERLKAMGL